MIGRLAGRLAEKTPPDVLLDVGGVGYEVAVPMSTFYNLPGLSEPVTLLIQPIVREDAHLLYGFLTVGERQAFRELIKVAGVGPRTALAVLSGLSVNDLTVAIATQEGARLLKVPGIGKKTAERLLLELKGKLADALPGVASVAGGAQTDIVQALMALGYGEKDAAAAVKRLPADVGVSEGIKLALKALG
ncbi:MAG: Holliday junction branch migration protein RuvA [Proteobacteria bacterium]|nr:Holliday junction branch migration protein RuvA [Pseudomonadota bacterium]